MSKKKEVDVESTSDDGQTDTKSLLDTARILTSTNKASVIPCKEDKQPMLSSVIDKRNRLRSEEELIEYFDPNNRRGMRAKYLGILLDSIMPLCALNMDRRGQNVFMTKILARCSEQLQKAINETTRTQTPSNSLHLLFSYSLEDFPYKISTHRYWKDKGGDTEHNEIKLMGTGYYLVEHGPGYKTIIGLDSIQTLNKVLMNELLSVLRRFEDETNVIEYFCAPNKLVKYYHKDNRDDLTMNLSGSLHRRGVPEYLICDLQEQLMDSVGGDEEAAYRYDVIRRTCAKPANMVNKDSLLLASLKQDHELFTEIKQQFAKLGYQSFSDNAKTEKSVSDAKEKQQQPREHYEYVQRFSNNDLLAESIIISGIPYFAKANHKTGEITIERELVFTEDNDGGDGGDGGGGDGEKKRIIRPQLVESYLSKPYSFKSKEEFHRVVELAKINTLDSLFLTVKNIWAMYIDADDYHLSICEQILSFPISRAR